MYEELPAPFYDSKDDYDMTIDEHSSEFMFGEILNRLKATEADMKEVKLSLFTMNTAITRLPCNIHSTQIDSIIRSQNSKTEKAKAHIQGKYIIYAALIAGLMSALAVIISRIV